jgi:hypothetical protein
MGGGRGAVGREREKEREREREGDCHGKRPYFSISGVDFITNGISNQ